MNLEAVKLRLETGGSRRILQMDLTLRTNTQSGGVLFWETPVLKLTWKALRYIFGSIISLYGEL
jgi:hypothetical protein